MTLLPLIVAACAMAVPAHAENFITVSTEQAQATRPSAASHAMNKVGAGNYLVSRFAQQHHDWQSAQKNMRALLEAGITQDEILRRTMILSMGAGDTETALKTAHMIMDGDNQQSIAIAQIFVVAEAMRSGRFKDAAVMLDKVPDDSTSRFIFPYLRAWSQASLGVLDIKNLKENTLQLYHAILISDFLGDYTEIKATLARAISVEDIHSDELMRIGDLYAHIGEKAKAIEIYNRALEISPGDAVIAEHKRAVESGKNEPLFPPVKNVQDGVARAFGDISTALYKEYNDESARIFANIALYIQPDMVEVRLLMAHIAARHGQYDEAIGFFKGLPKTHQNYQAAQYKIAELLVEDNRPNEAMVVLENLVKLTKDPEAQVRIGDIHRRAGSFGLALEAYNKATKMLGGSVPPEFWHLHYVRGMVHEQIGNWDKAEQDLLAALEAQPDHPYILNYLGYGWADRGENLEEARKMIARAVELRPTDGYIVDSLGWVLYKSGDFRGAVPVLEKAVALMPYDSTINDHLGDAYWRVGRKREARFQWERAKNYSEDAAITQKIAEKIENGLSDEAAVAADMRNVNATKQQ